MVLLHTAGKMECRLNEGRALDNINDLLTMVQLRLRRQYHTGAAIVNTHRELNERSMDPFI